MTKVIFTDRSRVESYQRCPRLRFLEYHEANMGIAPRKKSMALCVGGSVHKGLETLLRAAQGWREDYSVAVGLIRFNLEDAAVAAALADFSTHRSALALDTTEAAAQTATSPDKLHEQLAGSLGMTPEEAGLATMVEDVGRRAREFDDWLYNEQASLVEGMVRAYARRRLRPLLEEFEVLEVEQEGEWLLHEEPEDGHLYDEGGEIKALDDYKLMFMSRPDALLRSRSDNSLYLLSFKTAATWDIRKERDAQHDMQGLSEGVEVEKRLGEWWTALQEPSLKKHHITPGNISQTMAVWLRDLPAPPRILGIRYEYLLKGSRWEDRDLSSRFNIRVWAQRSLLVRAYYNSSAAQMEKCNCSANSDRGAQHDASCAGVQGMWCWAYDFMKEDGSSSKLYYKTWRPVPVWEMMHIKTWIDMLDSSEPTMSAYDSTTGLEPRLLGYHSKAQAQGYTVDHPLDSLFPAPLTVYRSDDDLRDWIEQVEALERRVAEAVAQIKAAADEGEKRHLLNVLMPMSRRACSYPTECVMCKICYGGDDIRRGPLASGQYVRRVPNHAAEKLAEEAREARDE